VIELRERETTIGGGESERGRKLSDPAAFDAFYAEALPVVYGYFLRRTGGVPAVAEDLTQETFLSAVRQIGKGTRVDAPMPWLIGIARHRLVDHYRTAAAEERRYRPIDSDTFDLADDRDEFAVVLDRQQAIAALDALPASQRLAISLRYLDGLSVPEIAREISKSVHAVESLLARGRATFKQHYLEHGHE
jgi:RNA polymerase sigma-70 factor (ECF subfamily)